MAACYVVATTRVSEFIAAMERMHVSQKIIIPFAVMFRFFPTIGDENRSIQDAMRLRSIGWKRGPVAMLEYRLVPLIVSVVRIGDELSAAAVQKQLLEAVHFEGSSEEKKIRAYLATLGIDYDALTKDEFISLVGILKKSKHMKSPISQRGKTTMTHGKGKRKKR